MKKIVVFLCLILLVSCNSDNQEVMPGQSAMAEFALKQIKRISEDLSVSFFLDTILYGEQEYSIEVRKMDVRITAGGERGLMYGGLEAAEQLELYGYVETCSGNPYIEQRGLKFNIPLDARTPSYDDSGDAAQKNIPVMWDLEFWREYLDQMALHRYNVLTLWNPHPFPSMIKLPDYPDVALDDVYRTTLVPEGIENEWGDPQLVTRNVIENLERIVEISIDEKIRFWQDVMQHAANRGIDIYWITWNICPNAVAPPVEPFYKTYKINMQEFPPGKHGVSYRMGDPVTIDYYRKSVKTFLETYPHVKGIGVTAGEHMPLDWEGYNRERWLWETYGAGILDLKNEQPGREITFIHRVWHSDMDQIMKYWGDYPDNFEVSFKYAKARLYSSPEPPFAQGHLEEMKRYGLKSWWNLRNDDIFIYRWGDPNYVRSFLRYFPLDQTAGFHMGSDGYVWGREFISKDPELSGELELEKHWYNFMLWGRLGYNPSLSEDFFVQKLKKHFEIDDADLLYETWSLASAIIPLVNTFHWRNWDFMWSVESCQGNPNSGGYHGLEEFMNSPPMEGSGMLSPQAYAEEVLMDNRSGKTSPMEVADQLEEIASSCMLYLPDLRNDDPNLAYARLLDDIEAQAQLGLYYASKIRAATHMAIYRINDDAWEIGKTLAQLDAGKAYWREYAEISANNYRPQMLARTDSLDWNRTYRLITEEIEEINSQFNKDLESLR